MSDSYKSQTGLVPYGRAMNIEFIASFAVVTPEPARSRTLYVDALGLATSLRNVLLAGSSHEALESIMPRVTRNDASHCRAIRA